MLGYKPPLAAHRLQMDLLTIDEHSADHRLTALQRAIARGQHERGLADGFDHQRPRLDLSHALSFREAEEPAISLQCSRDSPQT